MVYCRIVIAQNITSFCIYSIELRAHGMRCTLPGLGLNGKMRQIPEISCVANQTSSTWVLYILYWSRQNIFRAHLI